MKKKVIRLNENDIENIVRRIIEEGEFDWAKDISVEGKEYVLDLLNNTEERCFNNHFNVGCLYRHDRDNTFYVDEKDRRFIYDFGKVSLPLKRKFGIPEDDHDELIKSVVGYKYGDKYNDYKFKVINKGGHWNWRNFLR